MTPCGRCALFVAVAVAPTTALAQPARFVTLDRQDGDSFAGIEAAGVVPASYEAPVLSTAVRLDLHDELALTPKWGEYWAMSFSYGGGRTALGDAELGGQFTHHVGEHTIVAHAGFTLPTAGDPDLGNYEAATVRLTDTITSRRLETAARGGVSDLVRSGRWFARVDLGVDVGSSPLVMRANAGIGIDLTSTALMLESTNAAFIDSLGVYGKYFVDTAALSARFSAGNLQPYAAFGFGIDSDGRSAVRAALTVGIDARVR